MQVILASKTEPQWDMLSKVVPIEILDRGSVGTKAYFQVLSKIKQDPWAHIHYSFYFILDDGLSMFIMSQTTLKISFNDEYDDQCVGMMSGSLSDWRNAIEHFCRKTDVVQLRAFFNAIVLIMEKDGVPFPFLKTELKDRTFRV